MQPLSAQLKGPTHDHKFLFKTKVVVTGHWEQWRETGGNGLTSPGGNMWAMRAINYALHGRYTALNGSPNTLKLSETVYSQCVL